MSEQPHATHPITMSERSSNIQDYDIQVHLSTGDIDTEQWNSLLSRQAHPTPFMKMQYLAALERSQSATAETGWSTRFITVRKSGELVGACPMYLKTHSYGEFVFDWAWANAYEQHGVEYYPKALIAVPFTPVPGTRLIAKDSACAALLTQVIKAYVKQQTYSSAHLLFGASQDLEASHSSDYMLRHTVQFHWQNAHYENFDHFLSALNQDKRKKIKQERTKVSKAGVSLVAKQGEQITQQDWDFFYKCYAQTYFEHGNSPYLSRAFFEAMQQTMANNWVLFLAYDSDDNPIASSLIGISDPLPGQPRVAFGRYWGALQRVDCLHFEACYYAPIEWCIQNGFDRFEGGAQGEHKMARALMPVRTSSAHYLTHPEFARAVKNFLSREEKGIDNYMEDLQTRTPLKRGA